MKVNIDISTSGKYYEYAKIVAETICDIFSQIEDIQLEDLIKLTPTFKQHITIDNWFDASNISQLNELKVDDLKYILSVNCKKISGKKQHLINRLWEIHHPTYKNQIKSNKQTKKKKHNIYVNDSEDGHGAILNLLEMGVNIYIKNNSITTDKKRRYRHWYIKSNNWVFKEYPNRYEYLGILDNKKMLKTSIPPEIENYLMCC